MCEPEKGRVGNDEGERLESDQRLERGAASNAFDVDLLPYL